MDALSGQLATPAPTQQPPKPTAPVGARVDPAPRSGSTQDRPQAFQSAIEADLARQQSSRREVAPDPTTGSLVYRLIDVTTGLVTQQLPNESRLRLRAYIDGVIGPATPEPSVERTA